MRTPRAVITAFSLLVLLVAIGHTMGRLVYAEAFSVLGVRFGFTSLVEVVLIASFAVVAAAAHAGVPHPAAWIPRIKGILCCVLLFGAGFHLAGGEHQNLAAELGVSGPLMAQATFYDNAGHWVFVTVVAGLMALMAYEEVLDPVRPALAAWQRGLVVAEGLLLAAGASLTVIISRAVPWFAVLCVAGLVLLARRRPLLSPFAAYATSFFACSLVLVLVWQFLPGALHDRVLRPYVPGGMRGEGAGARAPAHAPAPAPRPLADRAREARMQLAERILPYWLDTAQDAANGGYLLSDDLVKGRTAPREKQVVTQARMVWVFAHAHLAGFSDARRNYLAAATQGYRFLVAHFIDRELGGAYWKTSLTGTPLVTHKFTYGQAFVIYALVEYYRASGDMEALGIALDVYRTLQRRAHDPRHGGWMEHFVRDWTPMPARDPASEVEVAGLKSANAHLHVMEALAELYDAGRDADVRTSLAEALDLNARHFFPAEAGRASAFRRPDWSVAAESEAAGVSYGHSLEFAWLMIRAETALGREPSWARARAYLGYVLTYGYDRERGGFYSRGRDSEPALDTTKVWWVQAEAIAALADAVRHEPNADDEAALGRTLDFVARHMTDPRDGIWVDTVTADGSPRRTGKAHAWKAGYHDVRALAKLSAATSPEASTSGR